MLSKVIKSSGNEISPGLVIGLHNQFVIFILKNKVQHEFKIYYSLTSIEHYFN